MAEGGPELPDEQIERVVVKVLEKLGYAARWDRAYKGDEHWLEFRAHAVQLVSKNVHVSFPDLDQDQWFSKAAGIRDPVQWRRAVDQHLVPNRPQGDDGRQFAAFSLTAADRRTRRLTFKSWLHCAIDKAAGPRRDLVRVTRERYKATERCEFCGGPGS